MAESPPADVGARLREARLKRGLSLKQIAASTRIAVGALEAIERNDISKLPGGIFARAFVRSYAREVGLDPEDTVRELLASFPHESVTAGLPHLGEGEENERIQSNRQAAETLVRLLVVSAPIALTMIYFAVTGRPSAGPPAPPAVAVRMDTAPQRDSVAAAREPHEARSTVGVADVERVPARDDQEPALTVAIRPVGLCWLSATVDGERALSRLMQAGDETVLRAGEEVVLTAGDAGAVELSINGAAARALGARGQVVTVRITAENYRDFLATNPSGQ